jgi:hypothetical protein
MCVHVCIELWFVEEKKSIDGFKIQHNIVDTYKGVQ